MKTRIARDARPVRRAAPTDPAAGTAGWSQAQSDHARVRTAVRAPADWKPRATLLVDDAPGPGQMDKRAWLAELRTAIIAGAGEELASGGWTADGCPWIEYWLTYYEGRSAQECEAALHRFAPATRHASSAHDYVDLVVARVRVAIRRWNRTGAIDAPFDAVPPEALAAFGPDGLRANLGPGEPLQGQSASRMRGAFGGALPDVSIHTGPAAAAAVSREGARAVAVGNHIAFGDGEYRPGTPHGDALLAHELAHVVQQRGSTTGDSTASAPLERDADRTTGGVLAALWGRMTGAARDPAARAPGLRSGLQLQRCRGRTEPQRYTGEQNPWGLRIISRDHPTVRTFAVGTTHSFITHRPEEDVSATRSIRADSTVTSPHVGLIRFHVRKPSGKTEDVRFPPTGGPTYTLDEPGTWIVVAEVRPETGGDNILLSDQFEVVSAEHYGEDLLKQSFGAKFDFRHFRVGLALEELRLGGGVTKDQPAHAEGAPYITARGDNPVESRVASNMYFDLHPTAGAEKFQWYFQADDLEALGGKDNNASKAVLPVVGPGYGRRWRTLSNIDAQGFAGGDDLTPTPSIGLSRSIPNIYWVLCEELDGNGKPLGTPTAVYKQAVLAPAHWKELEKLRTHIAKADKSIESISENSEVPVRAVLVARDGTVTPLALFAGRSAKDGDNVRLLDLTPNAPKSSYEIKSAPGAAASDDLLQKLVKDNEYPEGYVTMEISEAARSLGMAPGLKTKEITHPRSFASKFSSVSGWVSLGATVLGFLSLLSPFTAGASPYLFGLGAGAGAASAGASLVARFQEGRATPTGVAIDLLALATSLLQIKGLRMQGRIPQSIAAQGAAVVERNIRFLAYTQLGLEGAQAVLITADAVIQIDAILDNEDMSRSEKIEQVVRLIGQAALTGGLFVRSLKELSKLPKSLPSGRLRALDLDGSAFRGDVNAQRELYDAAIRMRDQQNELAEQISKELKLNLLPDARKSMLKRDSFEEFRDGIIEKVARKEYSSIQQMDDIVRGRINVDKPEDVQKVVDKLAQNPMHLETNVPKRRADVPSGYPRYHVIMKDPKTGLTHEWQVGTQATTDLFERTGIATGKLTLKPGMKPNIHDIEYDIFKSVQDKDKALADSLGIPAFRKDVATLAARTGREVIDNAALGKSIDELHVRASRILKDLIDKKGTAYVEGFFH